jgi:hypothetical protein
MPASRWTTTPPSVGCAAWSSAEKITTALAPSGTEVAALFYSLIETAKLCGVNPKTYLLEATHAALATPRHRAPATRPAEMTSRLTLPTPVVGKCE